MQDFIVFQSNNEFQHSRPGKYIEVFKFDYSLITSYK